MNFKKHARLQKSSLDSRSANEETKPQSVLSQETGLLDSNCLQGIIVKKSAYSIHLLGHIFYFFLLSFFILQSTADSAPSSHYNTVQKIYIGYYQRPADPAGLIYWAERLDGSGGNLNEIIEAFANSAESQTL